MNSTFYRKTGLFVALIFGLGFGFVMIRSSMDFETAADIAKGISFIPFSPWIFKVLSSFIPMDPAMFPIPDTTPFFSALLVLLLQTFIQSPVSSVPFCSGPMRTNIQLPMILTQHGQKARFTAVWASCWQSLSSFPSSHFYAVTF